MQEKKESVIKLLGKKIKRKFRGELESEKRLDDAIRKLSERRVPKSMFGAHPEMSSFTEKDKFRFHEHFFFLQKKTCAKRK